MQTTDFFGETPPQTFTIRGLLIPIVFGGKICNLECKIRSASVFGEPQQLGNLADTILFPKIFLQPKFSAKNAEQINLD